MHLRLLFGALALAGLGLPVRVSAQRVVLVPPAAADAVLVDTWNRVGAELSIHHFESRSSALPLQGDVAAALRGEARQQGALAVIAFVRADGVPTLHVWLDDPVSGQAGLHTLSLSGGSDTPNLLAVRAVDLLRASQQQYLADVQIVSPPSAAESSPAEPTPELELEEEPEPSTPPIPRAIWSLSAAGSGVWPGARFGFAVGPALGVRYRPAEWFGLAAFASGPILGAEVTTRVGNASMFFGYGLIEAQFALVRAGGFELAPTLGAGVFVLRASSDVAPPLRREVGVQWSWLFAAGLRAELLVARGIALALGVRTLANAPSIGVKVLMEPASLTQPALESSVGLVVEL